MTFILLAALMILAAGTCVAVPLWRTTDRGETASAVIAETQLAQLTELERDVASGLLSESDYRAAKRDLEAERSGPMAHFKATPGARPRRLLAALAALAVMTAAPVLYWYFGSWRAAVQGIDAASAQSIRDMVTQLDRRLHTTDGSDLEGWESLGHAYVIMGRYPDAVDAYSHARSLSADGNADVLAGYGEAVTLADPRNFTDQGLPAFEKALQLDPRNAVALWYGGLGALQRGDKPLAIQRWQGLLAQNPPEQYRQLIEKSIVEAGGSVNAAPAGAVIQLHVRLAAALQSAASRDAILFVFARPEGDASGPPLAVRRLSAAELPADINLSDADAVVAGRGLDGYPVLTLTARLSRSGSPLPQSGDLVGQARWSRGQRGVLQLSIDTVVK